MTSRLAQPKNRVLYIVVKRFDQKIATDIQSPFKNVLRWAVQNTAVTKS